MTPFPEMSSLLITCIPEDHISVLSPKVARAPSPIYSVIKTVVFVTPSLSTTTSRSVSTPASFPVAFGRSSHLLILVACLYLPKQETWESLMLPRQLPSRLSTRRVATLLSSSTRWLASTRKLLAAAPKGWLWFGLSWLAESFDVWNQESSLLWLQHLSDTCIKQKISLHVYPGIIKLSIP